MASTTSEILWLQQLLTDFGLSVSAPTLLFYDNQVVIHIASNPTLHERTKHIERDCHFVRDKVAAQMVKLMPIQSPTPIS